MRLIHYSDKSLKSIRPAAQDPEPSDKPHGLWVSVDAAWKDWCDEEGYCLHKVKVETELEIIEESRLLVLRAASSIIDFTKKFKATPNWAKAFCPTSTTYVDWSEVSELWSGIIIAPYIWECRLNEACIWYYGWDCASGCIWDNSIVRILNSEASAHHSLETEGD